MKTMFTAGIAVLLVGTGMTFAPAIADTSVPVAEQSVEEVISAPVVELPSEAVEVFTSPAPIIQETIPVIQEPVKVVESVIVEEVPIASAATPVAEAIATIPAPVNVPVEVVEVVVAEVAPDCTSLNLFTTVAGCSRIPEGLTETQIRTEAMSLFIALKSVSDSEASARYAASQVSGLAFQRDGMIYIESVISPGLVHVFN